MRSSNRFPVDKLLPFGVALAATSWMCRADVTMQEGKKTVRVEIDGKLFTEYVFEGSPHVYFYPLIGPGGAAMTRDWPMKDSPGGQHDHPHHRSFWFAHGAVNGIDFWAEPDSFEAGQKVHPLGRIEHEKFIEVAGGPSEGVIRDRLRWVSPDGTVPITSVQTLRVYERPDAERLFDYEMALTASGQDVTFGDTKEGTMALRVAESMRLKGPKNEVREGHMTDSEGDRDGAVWGKRANWVDYYGPVDGTVAGIAFFDHPQNPRHPTRWHARDYGLFAANPFCEHEMDPSKAAGAGDFVLPAGQTVTFQYRFLLHAGDTAQAKIAERYDAYCKGGK